LDFGGLAVGDPAGDVMAAFHLFSEESRLMFRTAVGADDATWARARGWALTQGLEALPYYLDTHPGMVARWHAGSSGQHSTKARARQ
jgi:aminoglycoside phosphotransferase (APT) family kinase protein